MRIYAYFPTRRITGPTAGDGRRASAHTIANDSRHDVQWVQSPVSRTAAGVPQGPGGFGGGVTHDNNRQLKSNAAVPVTSCRTAVEEIVGMFVIRIVL